MAGSNRGIARVNLFGCRVATSVKPGTTVLQRKVRFIPGGVNADGKKVDDCCRVDCFVNDRRGSSIYTVVAWGKLATIFAHGMAPGKEFNCIGYLKSYDGKIWDEDGKLITRKDGSPLTVRKHEVKVIDFTWGSDSNNLIAAEIVSKARPANWNDGGEGAAKFLAERKEALAKPYDGTSDTYGYARVHKTNRTAALATGTAAPTAATPAVTPEQVAAVLAAMNANVANAQAASASLDPKDEDIPF